MAIRVAIFGGSFNPPHVGHMFICQYLLATNLVDEVCIMPVYKHAFGKRLLPYDDRLDMCQSIAYEFPDDSVWVSNMERDTMVAGESGGINRTFDTLKECLTHYPDFRLSLVVGSDILVEKNRWHRFDEIEKMVDIIVVGRSGFPCPHDTVYMPGITSTAIRTRVASNLPINHLVHHSTLKYVDKLKELMLSP